MAKILIIEDQEEINNLLKEMLLGAGYEVSQAFSGSEGILRFQAEGADLLILDLMLPGIKGEDVLTRVREKSDTPVIVISAKTDIDGKVELLQNGADDYITKPFDLREVLARVELQLKKYANVSAVTGRDGANRMSCGELEMDQQLHQVFVKGNPVSLTKHEYNILELLLKHPDKIFSKQELFEQAWEEYYIGEDKTINVHVSNLRKKLKEFTDQEYIDTVWGIGFRLKQDKK